MANCSVILIHGIEDIDEKIRFNDEDVTLLQVFTSLHTSTSWDTPLFTQIHFLTLTMNTLEFVIITSVPKHFYSRHLVTLCIAHFGEEARKWFHNWAIENSSSTKFDPDTKKVVDETECDYDDIIFDTGNRFSDAQAQAIIRERGRDGLEEELEKFKEEDYDFYDDEKVEEEEETNNIQEDYVFELDFLFNLDPPHTRDGPHQCDETLATNATGAPKATVNLNKIADPERQTGEKSDG